MFLSHHYHQQRLSQVEETEDAHLIMTLGRRHWWLLRDPGHLTLDPTVTTLPLKYLKFVGGELTLELGGLPLVKVDRDFQLVYFLLSAPQLLAHFFELAALLVSRPLLTPSL